MSHQPTPRLSADHLEADAWLGRALTRQRRLGLALALVGGPVAAVSLYVLLAVLPETASGLGWFAVLLASSYVLAHGLGRLWAIGLWRWHRWANAELTLWHVRAARHENDWDGFTSWFALTLDDADPRDVPGAPAAIRVPDHHTSKTVDVRMTPSSPSGDELWTGKHVVLATAKDGAVLVGAVPTGRLYRCGMSPWNSLTELFHL